jgi:hypothetical protein
MTRLNNMVHCLDSQQLKTFLAAVGLKIVKKDSSHNVLHLVNIKTKEYIDIWAESAFTIAGGVPGMYVNDSETVSDLGEEQCSN